MNREAIAKAVACSLMGQHRMKALEFANVIDKHERCMDCGSRAPSMFTYDERLQAMRDKLWEQYDNDEEYVTWTD